MPEARRLFRLPAWAWPLLALPVVALVDLWTYTTIAAAIKLRLEGSLRTMLASTESALGQWLDAQTQLATAMARTRACARASQACWS